MSDSSLAAIGFQAVEEIAERLNGIDRTGDLENLPKAASFLARGAEGERNKLLVFLISELPSEPSGGRGPTVQIVNAEIGVMLLLPRRNDRGGRKARDKAEMFVDAARRRLIGPDGTHTGNAAWQPPSLNRPLAWRGGALEPYGDDDSYWVWLDRYAAEWTLDSQRFNGA